MDNINKIGCCSCLEWIMRLESRHIDAISSTIGFKMNANPFTQLIWMFLPLMVSMYSLFISFRIQREWKSWRSQHKSDARPLQKKPSISPETALETIKKRIPSHQVASAPEVASRTPTSKIKTAKLPVGSKPRSEHIPSRPLAIESVSTSKEASKATDSVSANTWEIFMGARLFAWIGGVALFFAIAFFVKYSFDHNLLPPEIRIALGYLTAGALLGGGIRMRRSPYHITSHTLCATGIVGLYAVTFAAHALYEFSLFRHETTFAWMSLITAGAIYLANRWRTQVVASLGMLGGFLTPMLLSSQNSDFVSLFVYIGLLNVGVLVVSVKRAWSWMVWASAIGTLWYEVMWVASHMAPFPWGSATMILLSFSVLFSLAESWMHRKHPLPGKVMLAFQIPAFCALLGAWVGMSDSGLIGTHPIWIALFILATHGCLMWQSIARPKLTYLDTVNAGLAFLVLSVWMGRFGDGLDPVWMVGTTLVFGLAQSLFLLFQWKNKAHDSWSIWHLGTPLLTFALMVVGLVQSMSVSEMIFPATLIVNASILTLAFITGSLTLVVGTIVLSFGILGVSLHAYPGTLEGAFGWLLLFSVFFLMAFQNVTRWREWLLHSKMGSLLGNVPNMETDRMDRLQKWGQVYASLLPFMLMLVLVGRISSPSLHLVMGTSLVLSGFVLWNSRHMDWLSLGGLGASLMVQFAWMERYGHEGGHTLVLLWFAVHYLLFLVAPFILRAEGTAPKGHWISSALSGVGHFGLVYAYVDQTYDWRWMGLLPVIFAFITLICLRRLWMQYPPETERNRSILVWFGGVACLFVTLIFPIQLHHEWLTIGWALEGTALIWLYRHIPHRGLIGWGAALLILGFIRLSFNPEVFSYHIRGDWPFFNWYLYAYSLVVGALACGGLQVKRYALNHESLRLSGWLLGMAVFLTFLLVNIQVADFFTSPGTKALVFDFSGNFARDLSYSMTWSVFAFCLLVFGLIKRVGPSRWAGLALMGVTLIKVFFHDIAHLEQLYRVGALVGVAVVAILSSFLYQKCSKSMDDTHVD